MNASLRPSYTICDIVQCCVTYCAAIVFLWSLIFDLVESFYQQKTGLKPSFIWSPECQSRKYISDRELLTREETGGWWTWHKKKGVATLALEEETARVIECNLAPGKNRQEQEVNLCQGYSRVDYKVNLILMHSRVRTKTQDLSLSYNLASWSWCTFPEANVHLIRLLSTFVTLLQSLFWNERSPWGWICWSIIMLHNHFWRRFEIKLIVLSSYSDGQVCIKLKFCCLFLLSF